MSDAEHEHDEKVEKEDSPNKPVQNVEGQAPAAYDPGYQVTETEDDGESEDASDPPEPAATD